MRTNREIAEQYAKDIKRAVKQTKLEKPIFEGLKQMVFLKEDPLFEAFREIKRDLDSYTSGKLFPEMTKMEILKELSKILGLSKPDNIAYIIKEANNENAIELLDYIGQFIDEVSEKMKEE
jgi:hypothetical protein